VPGSDPGHWLHRLDAAEWLAAAATELAHAEEKLSRRSVRPGVTHARRAAGMAWNAVLVTAPDDRYGRSYMDHVAALAQTPDDDASIPAGVRGAARLLRDTPAQPPELIALGKPDMSALDAAKAIVEFARAQVSENG
jgi:HEPN domain-containing protein